ncbi:MAG: redoxin domain-containing protein [Verrucomicrobia bacterium]|nr:redoxin domain-containing protein [Verrucomicrobiota bacterium]
MRSFQQRLAAFDARGIRVVAISTDAVEETRRHCARRGFTYTFLSDPKLEVISRYELLHRAGGIEHNDIARPAEFLIDSTGIIRWVNLTESITVRARPEQVLTAFDDLKLASPATK